MSAMRAYWILPNRDQRDDVLASDGVKVMPLRQVLDPKLRPAGFSHGVPTELLEGQRPLADVLFAQRFPDYDGGKQLFVVSAPAGVDASGRVVHLGLLFILEPRERPRFDLPYTGLSAGDQPYAQALLHRLASPEPGDAWAQSVWDLAALVSSAGPATNVELQRSSVRFHSLYAVGPAGLARKVTARARLHRSAMLVLVLVAIAGIWLSERTCAHASRPVVHPGVAHGV
jgi:hypothetical protein